MSTQSSSKHQSKSHPLQKKVMRTYRLAVDNLSLDQRREINLRIKKQEEAQKGLLTKSTVTTAIEQYRNDTSQKYFTRKLCKKIGRSPNIAESAFHWLYIAVKGKVEKEKKVQALLNFWQKNPQQAIEWIIFGRSPYTESSFQKYWKLKRRYIINLLTSSRRQLDSFLRKNNKDYRNNFLKFNDTLPSITYHEVVQSIEDALEYKNQEFDQLEELSSNQERFQSKLELLVKHKDKVASFIVSWINIKQKSRWKSLEETAKEINLSLGKKKRKLFSAIRLIIVFALFDDLWKTVPQLLTSTQPEKVVPLPFKRKKKGKLPIILLMNKKYVISREGNAAELTNLAISRNWLKLDFPRKSKAKFSAKVWFPDKVLEYMNNGAIIKVFQVSSGEAPSYKFRVDVILEGTHDCFNSTKLLDYYLTSIPKGLLSTIGVDINRLGEFMISLNINVDLPIDLLLLAEKYLHLREKTLPELNKGLSKYRKQKNSKYYCKLKGELRRVYNKQRNILQEIVRRAPFFLAAVMIKKKCQVLKTEELQFDPSGKKGALAKAIYSMPDSYHIFEKAVWLASKRLDYSVKFVQVSPHNTSRLHHSCNGIINRSTNNYDFASCKNVVKRSIHMKMLLKTLLKNQVNLSNFIPSPQRMCRGIKSSDD